MLDEIHNNNINVRELETEEITAAAIELNGSKKYIVFNKNKIKSRTHELTVLAHEFSHLMTGTLYRLEDNNIMQSKKEYKCNKYMIQKLVPIDKLKELIDKHYEKWELAEYFEVEEHIIDLAFDIYSKMAKL